jgi:GrpB-like predicted nucleotidyltransferase (UPF0157 family)
VIPIADYRPDWPAHFRAESAAIRQCTGDLLVELEHIGSTAVPGLAAKPIIDMMAAVRDLDHASTVAASVAPLGYTLTETGMRHRHFLVRPGTEPASPGFHLHVVELSTWPERNERLLRDALLQDATLVAEYASLKRTLALEHSDDMEAYTKAKTAFIQSAIDRARASLGLPRVDVWET